MKKIPNLISILPILFLINLLIINVYLYGDDSLSGPNQLALILSASIASIIGLIYGVEWKTIINGVSNSIKGVTSAIIILLLIGSLIGTWMISGIVPTMIYYGLQILEPKIFLTASCIICAIVSLSTGSSFSTVGTVGIALLGIGQALNIPIGLIGGSIISGAYFGDKMSPLSDTTNLAAAMAGTDLFTHIRYMMYTTIPSFINTLIIFLIIGINLNTETDQNINELLSILETSFNINIWLLAVPVIVIILIMKKTPAIPALFLGVLLGGICAGLFQQDIIHHIGNPHGKEQRYITTSYKAIMQAISGEVSIQSTNNHINNLLSTSGMIGMLNTIWLVICAMIFGGTIESVGLLKRISEPIMRYAKSTGDIVATTAGTCILFNIAVSDQYLSIIIPGKMFAKAYKEKGLSPENLSRTLEDSGTMTSVLIPWNTCGAVQSGVLGIAVITYLPYCFFNLISPIMTVIYAYLGIRIRRTI